MNNENEQFNYGEYARKSSESEDKQVQSIERQVDELMELSKKLGLNVYGEPIKESKSAFSIGRDGFNQLVSLTQKGKINAWLVWHANRLSRNAMDSGMIIHLMDLGLLHHIRTPSKIYYNTPTDKMMLQIEFTMSKKDSDDKSVFVKSGLEKRYKKGYPTGRAPIGFLNNKMEEKGNRGWLIDKERFNKVTLLFKQFLKGKDSLSSITKYAKEELELKTAPQKRLGNKYLGRSMISHVLKNPIYAGFFYANEQGTNKKIRRELTEEIPRMITEAEHRKVLQILRARVSPKMQKHDTLFQEMIKGANGEFIGADLKFQLICDCGKKFSYRSKTHCPSCFVPIDDMQSPRYLSYTYYYNIKRKRTPGLIAKSIEEEKIKNSVFQYLKENFYVHPHLARWAIKHLHLLKDQEIEQYSAELEKHEKTIKQTKSRKQKLLELYTGGNITEPEFVAENNRLTMKLESMKLEQDALDWFEVISREIKMGSMFMDILQNGSFSEKKKFFKEMSSNLVWNEKKLLFYNDIWHKEFIKGLKMVRSKYQEFEPENHVENKRKNTRIGVSCPIVLRWLKDVRTNLLRHKGEKDYL